MKSLVAILLFFISNNLSAQYLYYKDKSNTNRTAQPATEIIKVTEKPVEQPVKPVTHIRNFIPPKGNIIEPSINTVVVSDLITPLFDSQIIYHTWPDLCPGRPGSIPVLNNYVPHELVLKLTEIFQGHLYAITSIKVDNGKMNYQLKVCVNGEIKYEQANESGNII
jgi:hypothetical protein